MYNNIDKPIDIEEQVQLMKKYVVFTRKTKIRRLIQYTGYFRLSRYGKYLLSYSSILGEKPNQELLFQMYELDKELRYLLFKYCKKAEIQFKSHLSNAISLKTNDATFYINKEYYTSTKGEKSKTVRNRNINKFNKKFFPNIKDQEEGLRKNINKYPELREYRNGGTKSQTNIPSWAAFSYFEFGTITNIYNYLSGELRKEVLNYGYSKRRYGKEVTKQMDTWLDAIRNLRNACAHHNKIIGETSSIVLMSKEDDVVILKNNTDLFSRIYALKKILNEKDSIMFKEELSKLVNKSKLDIHKFNILPKNWGILFDKISYL